MASASPESKDAAPVKPTLSSSVDSFISKKKEERGVEGARQVQQASDEVQGEVADVMGGMEKPSDDISERKESKSDGDIKARGDGGGKGDDDGTGTTVTIKALPPEAIMVRKVRTAVRLQIKMEWKKAQRLKKNLTRGGAQDYNASIARIRGLKEVLSSLFSATFEYVKNLYLKYFQPDGRRRSAEEVNAD